MNENFLKHEFIGMPIKILTSTDKTLENMQGEIIDETKNMFLIETEGTTKKIIKDQCVFDVEGITIKGSEIARRPEERIKK